MANKVIKSSFDIAFEYLNVSSEEDLVKLFSLCDITWGKEFYNEMLRAMIRAGGVKSISIKLEPEITVEYQEKI